MANDVSLKAFPSNNCEALAMLFLQNQDLSGKSPEEIATIYDDTYEKIHVRLEQLRKERKELRRKANPYHSIL